MGSVGQEGTAISSSAKFVAEGMSNQVIDCVIRNATIVDGTGRTPYQADIAIGADRIVQIGSIGSTNCTEINAKGLCLSPGFIDVHTHDDIQVLKDPEMLAKVSQGVTSVIVGNCGISAIPVTLDTALPDPMSILGNCFDFTFDSVSKYAQAVYRAKPATNVATLVGHTSLRITTMDSLERPASRGEIAQMCEILDRSLQQGAIGLSTGLAYANARCSTTDEVLALAQVVRRHQGIYATHLRDEHDHIIAAMDEAFAIGEEAHISVVISHFKCAGLQNWGRTVETLKHLSQATGKIDVACDCYPYTASSTTLDVRQVTGDYEIFITWSESHPDEARQTLDDIAAKWQVSRVAAAERLQPAGAIYHNMREDDVERVLCYPDCMIGSDGLPNDDHPHPRLWGTFPRVIGRYGREKGLFKLEEAVRKMTSLPAAKFDLSDRGVIGEGKYADLVLFDPEKIIDAATYENPSQPATGILAVWVNGALTYQAEEGVSNRAGRLLTGSGFQAG